jgi:riboflavin-specific deaminase-like protein
VQASEIADDLVAEQRARGHAADRPWVMLNMASTADGRATLEGRSGSISSVADRELFHALRAIADAVLVGAGTLRAERYGRIIAAPDTRAARQAQGRSEEPLACVVSRTLRLDPQTPLLACAQARVLVITPCAGELPGGVRAQVQYVRARTADGLLDLPGALAQLRAQHGVQTLLCEGGPHLNGELFAAGLVDELLLALAPKLAGGNGIVADELAPSGEQRLRIVNGPELRPPLALELASALQSESHLFLRYRAAAQHGARVG